MTETENQPINAADRFFTYAANTILPNWCNSPEHWTSRFSEYMFTDCPCCLLFRGISLGFSFGIVLVGSLWMIFS